MAWCSGLVTMEDAYGILNGAKPGRADKNPEGLRGRVMTGYQGWFRAPGDGSGLGFHHYGVGREFSPEACTIDLWPETSELGQGERFATPFRHRDGRVAEVFSSVHPATVDRHFQWMDEYGIDGAFVQRFGTVVQGGLSSHELLRADNQKLLNCRDAANANGRAYALMYDLSGMKPGQFEELARDWKMLRTRMKLGQDENDRAYLYYHGKPLVAIWGVGFGDDREYSLKEVEWFIRLLKENPEWGGMSVMLGVPYYWREQESDATRDADLHRVLRLADVLSPWAVGRYDRVDFQSGRHVMHLLEDRKWCESAGVGYHPVVFPGFSWHNMTGEPLGKIPRRGGRFFWDQFVAVRAAGIESAYVAMFDEVDEGTAIFKVSHDPPVGEGFEFLTNDGLPPDHFLKLTGRGGQLLRGEIPAIIGQ